MGEGSVVTLTTRLWEGNKYDDYNARYGLDTHSEMREYDVYPPYLHKHNTEGGSVFDSYKDEFLKHESSNKNMLIKFVEGDKISELADHILGKEETEILIYIHGFNSSLQDAEDNGSELCGTGRRVVVFDWASTNGGGIKDVPMFYAKDEEAALASVRPLVWLLLLLFKSTRTVHILAHSMGSRIAIEALRQLSRESDLLLHCGNRLYQDLLAKVGYIVFKQPDVDIVNMSQFLFKEAMSMVKNNKRVSVRILSNQQDKALIASQDLHLGIPRVGQFSQNIMNSLIKHGIIKRKTDVHELLKDIIVDASKYCKEEKWWKISSYVKYGYANHSYFGCNQFVSDLKQMFEETVTSPYRSSEIEGNLAKFVRDRSVVQRNQVTDNPYRRSLKKRRQDPP